MNFLKAFLLAALLINFNSYSLPIDWNGSLNFETTVLKKVRGTSSNCSAQPTPVESQCIPNNDSKARFQTLQLQLNPTIIVNDSTSIKGEFSLGTQRGIVFGEDQANNGTGSYFSASQGGSNIVANQLYAELYADTAVYRVGKFSKQFGLGAMINSGKNPRDRFYTPYNGVEAEFKLGNFSFVPTWSKVASVEGRPGGKFDISENSIEISYDNSISGIEGGILYAKRTASESEELYSGSANPNTTHRAKLIDIYFKKSWESFSVGLEAPILSGSVGNSYNQNTNQNLDAKSVILETKYEASKKWSFDFNLGSVSGSTSDVADFGASYLNANYQLSNIMFRYNLRGFQNDGTNVTGENPFSSSITNATYVNLNTHYHTVNWKWSLGFMMAKAQETANAGQVYYNHARQAYTTTPVSFDQSDDLGYEVDLGFEYEWNPQIVVSGHFGYYSVGDFYGFNNTANELELENITSTGLNLAVKF